MFKKRYSLCISILAILYLNELKHNSKRTDSEFSDYTGNKSSNKALEEVKELEAMGGFSLIRYLRLGAYRGILHAFLKIWLTAHFVRTAEGNKNKNHCTKFDLVAKN